MTVAPLVFALAAPALLAACGSTDPLLDVPPEAPSDAPVVVWARQVCRIAGDAPGAASASVQGVDGATSVVVDGTAYWFFGDTVRAGPGGRQDVIPASVATTTDVDASDCMSLDFKRTANAAEPLFPQGDETTAWPDGILPMDDGSIVFYMVKAYRQSPFKWNVGSVGLGRVPAGSTEGERVVETIWDENSGFGSRVAGASSPVRVGDDVYVYIRADDGGTFVARAPIGRLADLAAYVYWDGASWRDHPSDAAPIWRAERGYLPADNGVYVYRDDDASKWIALYNADLARVTVRTADAPQGPWSEPTTWLDCRPLVEDHYPYCYSAVIHRELTKDDGRTLYVTFSSQRPYDVTLVELRTGVAIHEWRGSGGDLSYAPDRPSDRYEDGGIAFYASDSPQSGMTAYYEYPEDSVRWRSQAPEGGGELAFYAYPSSSSGAVPMAPVYDWRRDNERALDARQRPGWERGRTVFYAPCAGITPRPESCEF